MVRVQPYNYPIENRLIQKLDLMIQRCTQNKPKRDAVLNIEGAEGEGKTTFSIAIAYYVSEKTGRKFDHTHIYFDLRKLIERIQNTEEEILIWDEPALHGLGKDALTNIVKDLERVLVMARKKRHFIIINMAYFNMFSPYIVWQRPLGMIHVYSRKEIEAGRFIYIRKKALEGLYQDWRTKRKRNYRKWKCRGINGNFPDVLDPDYKNNVLKDFNVVAYNDAKDKAILQIGSNTKESFKEQINSIKYEFAIAADEHPAIKDVLCKIFNVKKVSIPKWKTRYKPPVPL